MNKKELIKALKNGYKDVEIAKHTNMSPQGVRWHRNRLSQEDLKLIENHRLAIIQGIFES